MNNTLVPDLPDIVEDTRHQRRLQRLHIHRTKLLDPKEADYVAVGQNGTTIGDCPAEAMERYKIEHKDRDSDCTHFKTGQDTVVMHAVMSLFGSDYDLQMRSTQELEGENRFHCHNVEVIPVPDISGTELPEEHIGDYDVSEIADKELLYAWGGFLVERVGTWSLPGPAEESTEEGLEK